MPEGGVPSKTCGIGDGISVRSAESTVGGIAGNDVAVEISKLCVGSWAVELFKTAVCVGDELGTGKVLMI